MVMDWMWANRLNTDTIKLLLLEGHPNPLGVCCCLVLMWSHSLLKEQVHNVDVLMDSTLLMENQISAVARSPFFHL